jgi:hypothetical protein
MSWVILAVLVAIVRWAISAYNQLVALRNRFRNAYAISMSSSSVAMT